MMLVPVPINELHAAWPFVRNGILDVVDKCSERYRPEDVYLALHTDGAVLLMIEHDGDEVGFTVVRQVDDPDGKTLFIWILWAPPGDLAPLEELVQCHLEKFATAAGCRRVRWESPRKWDSRGWGACVRYVYERDL